MARRGRLGIVAHYVLHNTLLFKGKVMRIDKDGTHVRGTNLVITFELSNLIKLERKVEGVCEPETCIYIHECAC
jgi:hypothetical protein